MATQEKSLNGITIAVSSGTLFNMEQERQVYEEEGLEKYALYQLKHKDQPLLPGVAFPLVKALMNVNSRLRELYPDSKELFNIVLMTNDHDQDEVRFINSINHYGLTVEKVCRSGAESTVGHLKAYMTDLYLSKDSEKVREAINKGIAAATMFACENEMELKDTELRVAFDGDGVLFSDESETVFMTEGLEPYIDNEKKFVNKPLKQGPLKGFLEALVKLQKKFLSKETCPIRTYLVTSRDEESGKARAQTTFRSWKLEVDEELYLTGKPKGPTLKTIRPLL
ncbi:cytosolic 5'-nucleotidase 1A-like [Sardina pilchardus]|uniref:cytosolic 5'-nucleotidase 1A-like n=1 Tax=Sardina pilchardus TaxID=27697 RepID=UPI002E0F0DB6